MWKWRPYRPSTSSVTRSPFRSCRGPVYRSATFEIVCGTIAVIITWVRPVGVPSMRTFRVRFSTSAPHAPLTNGCWRAVPGPNATVVPETPVIVRSSKPCHAGLPAAGCSVGAMVISSPACHPLGGCSTVIDVDPAATVVAARVQDVFGEPTASSVPDPVTQSPTSVGSTVSPPPWNVRSSIPTKRSRCVTAADAGRIESRPSTTMLRELWNVTARSGANTSAAWGSMVTPATVAAATSSVTLWPEPTITRSLGPGASPLLQTAGSDQLPDATVVTARASIATVVEPVTRFPARSTAVAENAWVPMPSGGDGLTTSAHVELATPESASVLAQRIEIASP